MISLARLQLTDRKIVLFLVLLAGLLRFGHMVLIADSPLFQVPTSDAWEHHRLALTLSSGDWLGRSVGPYHRPQLFAYILAALFSTFGQRFIVTHLFLGLVDTLAVAVWYALGRRAFSRPVAAIGTLFIVLHWTFVYFAGTGYMESFAMALNGVFLLALAWHGELLMRRANGHSALSPWIPLVAGGILGGLTILTRPTVLVTMPAIGFGLLWLHWKALGRHWRILVQPAVFALIVTLTISPNAIRHSTMFGIWAPLGTGSELNFHMGNRIDGWGWDVSSPGMEFGIYQKIPLVEGGVPPSVEAFRAYWRERNIEYVTSQTGDFLGGLGRKALQICNAYEIPCTQDFVYTKNRSPLLKVLPGLGLLLPLGFAGLGGMLVGAVALWRRRDSGSDLNTAQIWARAVLVLWVFCYASGVVLYLVIARHRLPILPPLFLLGGWALWQVIDGIRRKKPRTLGIWGAAILAGVVLSQLPVVRTDYFDKHERWWTRINLGTALMKMDQPMEAVAMLEEAREIKPEKLESYNQLALAYRQAGEYDAAAEAQRQLLMQLRMQYPGYYMVEAEVFERLAQLQMEAGQLEDAEQTARKLVRLVPNSPQTHYVLGLALQRQGELDEALVEWRRALDLAPGFPPARQAMEEFGRGE